MILRVPLTIHVTLDLDNVSVNQELLDVCVTSAKDSTTASL